MTEQFTQFNCLDIFVIVTERIIRLWLLGSLLHHANDVLSIICGKQNV